MSEALAAVPGQDGQEQPEGAVAAEARRVRVVGPGILLAVQSLLYMIVVASFIVTFTVQPFRIPSESMEPTLLVGDFLLVNKLSLGWDNKTLPLPNAEIRRGQIVVFHFPIDPATHLIKRVVGIPGDHLHLRGNRVYINGQPLREPYAMYSASAPDNYRDNFPRMQLADPAVNSEWWIAMRRLIEDGDLIVPEGEYFVLGDNRNDSEDSRYWGFVPRATIVGKPVLIYFSLRERGEDDEQEASGPGWRERLAHFARWDRMMQVVR